MANQVVDIQTRAATVTIKGFYIAIAVLITSTIGAGIGAYFAREPVQLAQKADRNTSQSDATNMLIIKPDSQLSGQ